eukprot:CAMPEP_0184721876 /NCGR_PEP_ID=MMETSP0314-20130426/20284_1 /TAXON_ID=38298 /ORGANISM="Rhodella maculata, Strain CCMP 736" /LENGTH=41 /DNA_ID= /DNA_START= /DNA_END= /DNA_ORIENTATION=
MINNTQACESPTKLASTGLGFPARPRLNPCRNPTLGNSTHG